MLKTLKSDFDSSSVILSSSSSSSSDNDENRILEKVQITMMKGTMKEGLGRATPQAAAQNTENLDKVCESGNMNIAAESTDVAAAVLAAETDAMLASFKAAVPGSPCVATASVTNEAVRKRLELGILRNSMRKYGIAEAEINRVLPIPNDNLSSEIDELAGNGSSASTPKAPTPKKSSKRTNKSKVTFRLEYENDDQDLDNVQDEQDLVLSSEMVSSARHSRSAAAPVQTKKKKKAISKKKTKPAPKPAQEEEGEGVRLEPCEILKSLFGLTDDATKKKTVTWAQMTTCLKHNFEWIFYESENLKGAFMPPKGGKAAKNGLTMEGILDVLGSETLTEFVAKYSMDLERDDFCDSFLTELRIRIPDDEDVDWNSALSICVEDGHEDLLDIYGQAISRNFRNIPLPLEDDICDGLLHYYCKQDAIEMIKVLLGVNADPNTTNKHGLTPLFISAMKGSLEACTLLLQSHADPNVGNSHGSTPLNIASEKDHLEICQLLLEYNADLHLITKDLWSPFSNAVHNSNWNTTTLFLEHGADPNAVLGKGYTPVTVSVVQGDLRIFQLLLENGGKTNVTSHDGKTLEQHAEKMGHTAILEILAIRNRKRKDDSPSKKKKKKKNKKEVVLVVREIVDEGPEQVDEHAPGTEIADQQEQRLEEEVDGGAIYEDAPADPQIAIAESTFV